MWYWACGLATFTYFLYEEERTGKYGVMSMHPELMPAAFIVIILLWPVVVLGMLTKGMH